MTKRIVVLTNDPRNPRSELTINGQVIETLSWTPRRFKLPGYQPVANCPYITIRSLDDTPFSITGFFATERVIVASFDPNLKAPEFTLKPTVDTTKFKALTTPTCSIMITLDHPSYKVITLSFDVVPPLEVIPAQILVFNARAGGVLDKTVHVVDNQVDPNTGAPVTVESVTTKFGSRVELRAVTPKKAGCDLNLEIWPAGSKENEAFSSDQLVIKLKDGRELTVPVRVFYQSPTVSSAASQGLSK